MLIKISVVYVHLKNHAEIFRVVTNIHMIRISHKNTLIDRHDMNEGREKTLGR
jgi:hypothetical protein